MLPVSLLPALAALVTGQPRTAPPPSPPSPGQTSQAYDEQIRRDFRSAEALQGPLDGGFVLARPDGRPIYRFQLADPGVPDGWPEGAWRKFGRGRKPSGLVDIVGWDGPRLVLRFDERPGRLVDIRVTPEGNGPWRGRMWRLGFVRPVVLTKTPF